MRRLYWVVMSVGLLGLGFACWLSGCGGGIGGPTTGAGTTGEEELAGRGKNVVVEVQEVRGKPVIVNGKRLKLWVFVYPEPRGKPKPPPSYCTDGDQLQQVPKFANANPSGLTFNINQNSIPFKNKAPATQAIHDSFNAWDGVDTTNTYFTVNDTGGASGPAADGNNTVGWVYIVPRTVLAATWVWTDESNTVLQADVFFNRYHKWGVFLNCNEQGTYEVGNVGTHEVGHTAGLDHLSDPNAYATMYPTAPKGETRKRTLTNGDAAGYVAAGGY